jgi:aspartate racemase
MQDIIAGLASQGAEGIILGCTELELLITQTLTPLPLFPTTQIHAAAAVNQALND